ncbi:MAG TPA: hypothetical protein VEA60_03915, partial [Allosphingosinicella sp.]|nr:hypothetical protein [Allosphingosinicella sp.]
MLGARGLLGGASLGNGGEQVYFNAANGNLLISRQDEFLIGRGPDLSIARTYNSKGDFSDENGDNWRQSTDRRVYGLIGDPKTAGSTIKRVSGDGSVITYTWDAGDDLYIADDGGGAYDTLSYSVSGDLWTWTDGDSRISEKYEAGAAGSWRIAQQFDPNGNIVTFSYDAAGGNLEKVITADGAFTEYVWDTSLDRIIEVVTGYTDLTALAAKTLTRTSYGYDLTTGRLATVTVDLTPANTGDNAAYRTDYAYNAAGRIESITQSDGSSLDILYDSSGRVIRLTQAASSTVDRVTEIWYGVGYARITDPSGHITRLYSDALGNLTTIQHDPADGAAASTSISFTYNENGDVLSVVDQAGNATTYSEYDDRGNAATERGPAGTYIRRAYGTRNELLAETSIGSDAGSSSANHTTRYVYDGQNHLRYVVTSDGRVTEHRYNAAGQQVSTIRYAAQGPDPASHGITSIYVSFTEAQMNAWVSAIADKSTAERTDTFYDHRGNVSRVVSYSVLSKFGEGGGGPLTITPGANTTVTQQPDGLYRVVKTTGAELGYDADAHSSVRADGDFVVQLRPLQEDKLVIAGVATTPTTDASQNDPDYAFYFNDNGRLYYRESGSVGYFGRAYSAGSNYWLVRENGIVGYYVGSTLEAAKAAGALRSVADARAFYFDSSIHSPGAGIDIAFTSNPITNDGNTTVTTTADGLYRITKTGGTHAVFDAAASSSTAASGDFVLRLRPPRKDRSVAAGVSTAPATSLARTDIDYGFYFHSSGTLQYVNSSGGGTSFGVSYAAGENFWLVRSGTTISHYRGPTLAAAIAAGSLRTVTGVTGTFYFDSSFYTANAAVDVEFTPSLSATAELNRTYFTYDQAGNLLSRFREGQNPETFVYDGMGRLIASTDVSRGTTSIAFNDAGRQTVVTLDNGLVRTSTYNMAGDLTAVTEAGEYLATTPADSYRYDFNGRLRIATDSTGRTTYFVYDKLSRRVAEIAEDGATVEYRYDTLDRLTATIRYGNKVSSATLTTLGNSYSEVDMAGIRPGPHPGDIWNWSFYDAENRLIRSIDGSGGVTTFAYDRSHRLVKTYAYATRLTDLSGLEGVPPTEPANPATSAADRITRKFYDDDGNLIALLDGEGFLHRSIYDLTGRKTSELTYTQATDPAYRDTGTYSQLRASVSAEDYRITRYVYDSRGLLRFELDTLDQVTEYRYDRAGLRTTTLRYPAAIVPNADYSFANIKAIVAAAGLASHADTRTSWEIYDAAGRLAYSIDGENAVTGFAYDEMGQAVRIVRYATERATTTLPSLATMNSWAALEATDTANRVTRNYYSDRAGEVRFTVDAEGYATRFDYDEEGRVVAEVRWSNKIAAGDGSTIVDVETAANASGGFVTRSFAYDIAGRLSSTYDGNGVRRLFSYSANGTLLWDIADYLGADESRTRFEYDGAGRVAKRHDAYNSPTDAAITSYSYDAFGNVATVIDPRGHVTRYYYDRLGQELLCWDAEDYLTEKSYDAFGQVAKVTRRHNKA